MTKLRSKLPNALYLVLAVTVHVRVVASADKKKHYAIYDRVYGWLLFLFRQHLS